ncbi:hypothetical protein ACJMK2_023149, partial [Sinanodonta woodiana]
FANDDDADKYATVLQKFDENFVPKSNVIHERVLSQIPGKSVEEFVRKLNEFADYCDFSAERDETIRDRLVIAILQKKLQMEADLTLVKAIQIARQSELVK